MICWFTPKFFSGSSENFDMLKFGLSSQSSKLLEEDLGDDGSLDSGASEPREDEDDEKLDLVDASLCLD